MEYTNRVPDSLGPYWHRLAPLLASPLGNRSDDLKPGYARLAFAIDCHVDSGGKSPLRGFAAVSAAFRSWVARARYARTVYVLAERCLDKRGRTKLYLRDNHDGQGKVSLDDLFIAATLRVVDIDAHGLDQASLTGYAEALARSFGQRIVALRRADSDRVLYVVQH